ncbi:ABC transporter substrate-binding protein [Mesorhizobium sp.]|uniref:ABC transporter substrate-binding protein n=1 Tax=Mesorhizobium sp. TaxID=1871066 RepID=UPI0012297270|nr:ABC transporter substrate-binding protein [Mesorhizobium sp.]TIO32264.1 MAG: peptide ABC transporter substrate-binding protein [Mesorhizobium sp.]TIQ03281.1 MAG: peptide ABC transporter substrate-binding protein [Mesorhizobium sp.]
MKDMRFDVSRRALLMRGAALGGGMLAAGMPLSHAIWASEGKVLNARSTDDLSTLDPGFYNLNHEVDVMNCVYSKLTRYKPGSEWAWELEAAEKVEQVDPTHIRFRLKKGIKFTGGYGELTAKDVKFSFERVIRHNSPVKVDWGPLDRVEIEDDYTGVIVLKTPFAPLWMISLPFAVGHIVSEEAVMKATKDGGSFGTKPPAFSGPYVIADWKPNQYVLLVRNSDWSGPTPGFDEIRIVPISDTKAAERAYQAGDIDFTEISLDSLSKFKSNPPADTQIEEHTSLSYNWVGMNMDHPKLKDINVRRAIQWAINVPQILDAAYAGQAAVATGIVPPGIVGHREKALVPPEGDLEKAKEFLKMAGVSDLTLTIGCSTSSGSSAIAQTVQAQLSQIGISLQVSVLDSGTFGTLGMESQGERWKDIQLIVNSFASMPDPYYPTSWFVQAQVGIWNWERFRSKRYDELTSEALTVSDPKERAKRYNEMQDLMEESGAYRFLTHGGSPIVYRTTRLKPATRPDAYPLYLDFKAV